MVLAVMTISLHHFVSREALLAVPRDQREAALALGATRWETTWQIVVPYAKLGILGSIFLGLARALGETMAVTMVIGNDPKITLRCSRRAIPLRRDRQRVRRSHRASLSLGALIELGLVLFLTHHRHQRPRTADGDGHHARRVQEMMRMNPPLAQVRQRRDAHGDRRLHGAHRLGPVPHPRIPGVLRRPSLDWNFFTKLPLPPGEIGGGMANAIVGSAEIVGVAALIGAARRVSRRHLPG
jgi:hypothetical protein